MKLDENGDGKADGGSYKYESVNVNQTEGEANE